MTRHFRISFLALLATIACSGERHLENGIVIAAPDSYVGASILLDSKKIGDLQYLETHGGLFEAMLKKMYGDSPATHVVALKIDFAGTAIRAGEHQLLLETAGQPTAAGSFVFPFHGGPVQLFFVNRTKIEAQRGAA